MNKVLFSGILLIFLFTAQVVIARPLNVFVSILPQKYFAEKIGGDLVKVTVMVPPGASPATYEPKPKQMVALAKTDIYFAVGVPFETTWLAKIAATNPKMLIVHTEAGIEKMVMTSPHHHGLDSVQHHDEEKHEHQVKDPHVWLSPPLVMQQARNTLHGLLALDAPHRSSYEANYRKFIMELVELDLELNRMFDTERGQVEFMVLHPSWGYFARTYGLEQVPIEMEGKEPKPAELQYLIQYAKEHGIKVIFVQPQFSWQAAQAIAQTIRGEIAFVDPLALDWATNLREVGKKFSAALR